MRAWTSGPERALEVRVAVEPDLAHEPQHGRPGHARVRRRGAAGSRGLRSGRARAGPRDPAFGGRHVAQPFADLLADRLARVRGHLLGLPSDAPFWAAVRILTHPNTQGKTVTSLTGSRTRRTNARYVTERARGMLRRSFALVFVLCLTAAACSTSDSGGDDGGGGTDGGGEASGEPIVIGFPADLTTDWAYYDAPMEEGAQFAVDEINENGGVLGRPARAEDRRHAQRRGGGGEGHPAAHRRGGRVPHRHRGRRHPRRGSGRLRGRRADLDRARHGADARRRHGRVRVSADDE